MSQMNITEKTSCLDAANIKILRSCIPDTYDGTTPEFKKKPYPLQK